MAVAARAYQHGSSAPAQPRREQTVRVISGRRRPVETIDPRLVTLARLAVIAFAIFAALGCVRIFLMSSAVTVSMETEQIASNIEDAQTTATALEVEETELSNATSVKKAASALGMTESSSSETIKLAEDVVATDDKGNLSLARSLAVAAQG